MASGDMRNHIVKRATMLTTDATETTVSALSVPIPDLSLTYSRLIGCATRLSGGQLTVDQTTLLVDFRSVGRRYDADTPSGLNGLGSDDQNVSLLGTYVAAIEHNNGAAEVRVHVTGAASENVRWELRLEVMIIEETVDTAAAG